MSGEQVCAVFGCREEGMWWSAADEAWFCQPCAIANMPGDAEGCYLTPDGWCRTHSTSAGPAYCPGPAPDASGDAGEGGGS